MVEIALYRRTLVRRCYGGNLEGLLVQTLKRINTIEIFKYHK